MAKLRKTLRKFNPARYFSSKQIKNYWRNLLIVSGLFIVVYVPIKAVYNKRIDNEILRKRSYTQEETSELAMEPDINDFVFLTNPRESRPQIIPSRRQKQNWSDEDAAQYWLDPAQAGIKELPQKNRQLMWDFLQRLAVEDANF